MRISSRRFTMSKREQRRWNHACGAHAAGHDLQRARSPPGRTLKPALVARRSAARWIEPRSAAARWQRMPAEPGHNYHRIPPLRDAIPPGHGKIIDRHAPAVIKAAGASPPSSLVVFWLRLAWLSELSLCPPLPLGPHRSGSKAKPPIFLCPAPSCPIGCRNFKKSIKPKHDPFIKTSRMCGSCHTLSLPDRGQKTNGPQPGTGDLPRVAQ